MHYLGFHNIIVGTSYFLMVRHNYEILDLSNYELCYSISKLIDDEKDTLKSFITFNNVPREPIFQAVEGSQIVVPPNNPPS